MSTSTKTNPVAPDLDVATERARDANHRLAEVSRKVTTAYLDGVEKYVSGSSSARLAARPRLTGSPHCSRRTRT
jgi:hypothetical protein